MKAALFSKDRYTAIYLLQYFKPDELKLLFPELVFLGSSSHGLVGAVRQAILSIPKEWVIANIEQFAEPILVDGSYAEYRRYLELYIQLDQGLTARLARRAASNPDPDIQEAGEDYLKLLGEAASPQE